MFDSCLEPGDGEPIYNERRRWLRSHKPRECGECGGVIPPYRPYEFTTGKCDGSPFSFRTCQTCKRVRDDLYRPEFTYGRLWEDIEEAYGCGLHEPTTGLWDPQTDEEDIEDNLGHVEWVKRQETDAQRAVRVRVQTGMEAAGAVIRFLRAAAGGSEG